MSGDIYRPDKLIIDYEGNGEFTISDDNQYQCGVFFKFDPTTTDYTSEGCHEFAKHLVELYNISRLNK